MVVDMILTVCCSCCYYYLLKIPFKMITWIFQQFVSLYNFFRHFLPQGGHKYHRVENDIESGSEAGTDDYRKAIEANMRIEQLEKQLECVTKERFQLQENAREIGQLRKEKENAFKMFRDSQEKITALQKEKGDVTTRFQDSQEQINVLQKEKSDVLTRFQDCQEKINVLQKEKSDALTRLSEVMGSKLRDNNPAITDLNDPNRPMKLGDQFSELYENEWTDAYSELEDSKKFAEIEIIEILLKILREIYDICLADVSQQMSGHRNTVHGLSDDEIEGFIKAVKDSIKTNASKYIPLLRKKITSESSSCKTVVQHRDCCLAYIEICVNLCYFVAVQDPPMVIDFDPGPIFDKQSWKEYTRSGTEVEYVVWPTLYLYKGGPIMSKGVVQPKETN